MDYLANLFTLIDATMPDEEYLNQLKHLGNYLGQVFKSHSNDLINLMELIEFFYRDLELKKSLNIDPTTDATTVKMSTEILNFFPDKRKFVQKTFSYAYDIPGYQANSQIFLMFNPLIDDSDLFFTICKLPSLKNLKSFTLNNICIRADLLLILLTRVLGLFTSLEKLSISNCEFPQNFQGEKEAFSAFGRSLMLMRQMKEFSFLNNKMNDEWILYFLHLPGSKESVFDRLMGLEKLRIGSLELKSSERLVKESCSTFEVIKNKFGYKPDFITTSKLSNQDENDETVNTKLVNFSDSSQDNKRFNFFKGLENCLKLKELHLTGFKYFNKNSVSRLISNNKCLIYINLSNNSLGERDLISILTQSTDKKIESLIIKNNSLSSSGYLTLINFASRYFKKLKILSVKKNQITKLQPELSNFHLKSIEKLWLDSNNLQDSYETILMFIFRNFKTLDYVSLKNCGIRIEFIERIFFILKRKLILVKQKNKEIWVYPTNEKTQIFYNHFLDFKNKFFTFNLRKNGLAINTNWIRNVKNLNTDEIIQSRKDLEMNPGFKSKVEDDASYSQLPTKGMKLPDDRRITIYY